MNSILSSAYEKQGKKIEDNRAERIAIWQEIDKDPTYAAVQKAHALDDVLHFFKYFAWTHDPRPAILAQYGCKSPRLPFLLYDFQEDAVLKLVDHISNSKDLLIEKSRDMGVSWIVITVILWFWLQPQAGNDFLFGSRKFDFVDKKGSQDTLFQKFRYNLYGIPKELRPQGFEENLHDNVAFIANPETGSYIRGESNNANFGTAGRYKAVFPDEFAKWEETDDQAWTSMGDSSPCRIPVSTPWGLGRKFAQLRFSGAIEVLTLHWTLHPIKAAGLTEDPEGKKHSPWYDAECERRKDDPMANIGQELDINYLTSGSPYFDNTLISQKYQNLKQPAWKRYSFERKGEEIELFEYANGLLIIVDEPLEKVQDEYKIYRYCISADVSEGLEKSDFDSCYVYDRVTGKDVAWFHGRIDTDVYALLLNHLSKMYKYAWIAVENNNHGHAVIQKLKTINYNLLFEQDFSQYADRSNLKLGWNTNMKTRPIMFAELREAINQDQEGVIDKEVYNEAMTFIFNKNGKPEAGAGCYDDRVVAQAIKFQIHKWLPAPQKVKPEETLYDKKLREVTTRPMSAFV